MCIEEAGTDRRSGRTPTLTERRTVIHGQNGTKREVTEKTDCGKTGTKYLSSIIF